VTCTEPLIGRWQVRELVYRQDYDEAVVASVPMIRDMCYVNYVDLELFVLSGHAHVRAGQ
jgi:hypothetical protein